MSGLKRWVLGGWLLVALTGLAAADQKNMMSVTVEQAAVRATPSFLGKIVASLAYGDRVAVVAEKQDWVEVALPQGGDGWLHSSALTTKVVVLQSGQNVSQSASSSEVALAGKGFNEQVETQYQDESHLDYTWVNRMEKIVFSPDVLVKFLAEGGITGDQGGGN